MTVLVQSGNYNKRPQTAWLINNRNYFLQFWRLKVQDQGAAWSPSGEGLFLGCRRQTSHCAHMTERHGNFLGPLETLISLMRAMSSWCNHHSEAPFPNTIILGIRIPICEFWGHTSIQTTALNIIIMSLKCRKSCGLLHQWMQIRGWGRVQRAVSLLESPWSVLHCLILEHDWMNKKCEML